MSTPRRFLTLLGGAAAALGVSFLVPMALGHAETPTFPPADGGPYETCDNGICLVLDQEAAPTAGWQYDGLRPVFTDWQTDNQPYNVVGEDGSVLGSYDMYVQDMWSPYIAVSHYEYGDFTPSTTAGSDADLGAFADLSGATVYNTSYYDGAAELLTLNDVTVHGHELSYVVFSMDDFTSVVAHTANESVAYYEIGDSGPIFLWDSFFHSEAPDVPDYLIPADPFNVIDFDPSDYLFDGLAAGAAEML